jgi:hypothetical protein
MGLDVTRQEALHQDCYLIVGLSSITNHLLDCLVLMGKAVAVHLAIADLAFPQLTSQVLVHVGID